MGLVNLLRAPLRRLRPHLRPLVEDLADGLADRGVDGDLPADHIGGRLKDLLRRGKSATDELLRRLQRLQGLLLNLIAQVLLIIFNGNRWRWRWYFVAILIEAAVFSRSCGRRLGRRHRIRPPRRPSSLPLLAPVLQQRPLHLGHQRAVVQLKVQVAVVELLHALHRLHAANVAPGDAPVPGGELRRGRVLAPRNQRHLVAGHALVHVHQVALALLQLAPLLVPLVDQPEVVDVQLRGVVLLAVVGDEGHLEVVVAHEVQHLADVPQDGVRLAAAVGPPPARVELLLPGDHVHGEEVLVDPGGLLLDLLLAAGRHLDGAQLKALRRVGVADLIVPGGEVTPFELRRLIELKDALAGGVAAFLLPRGALGTTLAAVLVLQVLLLLQVLHVFVLVEAVALAVVVGVLVHLGVVKVDAEDVLRLLQRLVGEAFALFGALPARYGTVVVIDDEAVVVVLRVLRVDARVVVVQCLALLVLVLARTLVAVLADLPFAVLRVALLLFNVIVDQVLHLLADSRF
ncbi:hypothetical protein TYRP_015561 [Tyrophagus putrescentiae]|nr:hypothetical protein TYRP_015561 [Tyrophagus putrescentiae]